MNIQVGARAFKIIKSIDKLCIFAYDTTFMIVRNQAIGLPERFNYLFRKGKKMPKMKTNSSAKKRFKKTASGKVKFYSAYLSHNTSSRPTQMKRQNRGSQIMQDCDAKNVIKYLMPNG